MSKLSDEDIINLAKLSKLKLTKEEVAFYKKDLSAIVGYAEILQEVDIDGLEPTSQVTGLTNVVRQDQVIEYGATPDELLANAPDSQEHMFKVKRMIG